VSEQTGLFALIGAGPSLDYCATEIQELIRRGAHFFISDSVAAAFLRRWRPARARVFTVELRRHFYLTRINRDSEFVILAYSRANPRNLHVSGSRVVSQFRLHGESGDLPALISPGTVLGVMLSCATQVNIDSRNREIHLLGADLCYLENQVYSRYIDDHCPASNRLISREHWQYEMVLKKSTQHFIRAGLAIRTSFEFMQTRENMRQFVEVQAATVRYVEYSPLGLDTTGVEKQVPRQ